VSVHRRTAPAEAGHLPRIALLESRMSRELSRLVEKHGGNPLCVPALREAPAASAEATREVVEALVQNKHEIVVFMTGVAASLLFEAAESAGRRQELYRWLMPEDTRGLELLVRRLLSGEVDALVITCQVSFGICSKWRLGSRFGSR
jgi:Uroporphyrinogen-III synthase HemD